MSAKTSHEKKALIIYNPNSGKKRKALLGGNLISLEEIGSLFLQYQIIPEFVATKHPRHGRELAKEAVKKDYSLIVAAGGDGTVSEVANGLIHSDIPLGIIPLGTFMNIARMLSIPLDLEKAVMIIKMGRTRKIDAGCITRLDGEKLVKPYYFFENAGVGLEANIQEDILDLERGKLKAIPSIINHLLELYNHKAEIVIDEKVVETRASIVSISNGPYTGASLKWAPDAKLNDHKLTVSLFNMSKLELTNYFLNLLRGKVKRTKKIKVFQGEKVQIRTKKDRPVHADGSLFATTPIELKIIPNALTVITGFPKPDEPSALKKRTLLDP